MSLSHVNGDIKVGLYDEEFWLNPLKLVYWPARKMLFCADIHIGKGEHFRRHGIGVPLLLNKNNFWNLSAAFEKYQPDVFLVLGDMVHSDRNGEWEDFWDFMDNYPKLNRLLVKGNHEPKDDALFRHSGFTLMNDLRCDQITFSHEPLETIPEGRYNFCGHLHPSIRLNGSARQSLKLPCFWFGKNQAVLPAFGEFTGTYQVRPKRGDQIFVVSERNVIEIVPGGNGNTSI